MFNSSLLYSAMHVPARNLELVVSERCPTTWGTY